VSGVIFQRAACLSQQISQLHQLLRGQVPELPQMAVFQGSNQMIEEFDS
jgi:hypothetical protein